MPTRSLPVSPSFDFLRKQAKERLVALREDRPATKLSDAQFALAKEYGFESWGRLKKSILKSPPSSLAGAMSALSAGLPVILYDDFGQEDEGDFVFAAEKITAEGINFLTKNGRGMVCLALPPEKVDHLNLPLIRSERETIAHAAFTVSIDARKGITTGVSAADRAATILTAVSDSSSSADLRSPGHIFPLRSVPGGLKERRGHTEASIELVKRTGMKPAAVICEILNDDGTMARFVDVKKIALERQIPLVRFSDLQP